MKNNLKTSNFIFCFLLVALCVIPCAETEGKGKKGPPPPSPQQMKAYREIEDAVRKANTKLGELGSQKLGAEMSASQKEAIFQEFVQLVEDVRSKVKGASLHKTHSTELNAHLKKFDAVVKDFGEKGKK